MNITRSAIQKQEQTGLQSKIDAFFKLFTIASLMHKCGIRKHHGHSVSSLTKTIFLLPFMRMNFFRGIACNNDLPFGKDAAYELLKRANSNWRRLLLLLGKRLFNFFDHLTQDDRDTVLIIDDSLYDRSRSKRVELLARVYDHVDKCYRKGFRMLTCCWSDGASCLPLDFVLLSSADSKQRLCESSKTLDKRSCAYKRRKEATQKATSLLEGMVKRIFAAGISAKYLLMDSWFTAPAILTALTVHIKVIGRVKKTSKVHYRFNGVRLDVKAIYSKLKKRRGLAKILASTNVMLDDTVEAKLVFIRHRTKKDWLAIISTDTELTDEDIVRIYGKRWDIEVFFKMAKQHLKLAKEIQCRDYDALVAHTTFVFLRYIFLAYQNRCETDSRSMGDLFYYACEDIKDISFMEALFRIIQLTLEDLNPSLTP